MAEDSPTLAVIAAKLSAGERVALFCVATGINHPAIGILASMMQTLRARKLIMHSGPSHYVLTDLGHGVFRALLEQGGFKLAD
jgi:hypothetical protein